MENEVNTEQTAPETPAETPKPESPPKARRSISKRLILVVVLLMALAAAGGYYARDMSARDQRQKQAAEITDLKKSVADLKKAAAAKDKEATATKPASTKPSAATIENIKDSIISGNTAALEGYMASTVRVIIAATEGVGDRTPAQAVSDLQYIDSATDPWDFNLPAATLASWQAGSYKSYFPTDAVVGKSADDQVISFSFDSAGKINGIFLAKDAGSLAS